MRKSVVVVAKLCLTLWPHGLQPPISSVHEIFQARILEWVAISFSRGSSRPKEQTLISCIDRWILYHWTTREASWRGIGEQKEDNEASLLRTATIAHRNCSPSLRSKVFRDWPMEIWKTGYNIGAHARADKYRGDNTPLQCVLRGGSGCKWRETSTEEMDPWLEGVPYIDFFCLHKKETQK